MAGIRQKKKRHDTINANNSYVIKMEKDRMNRWTKNERIYIFMKIVLQMFYHSKGGRKR